MKNDRDFLLHYARVCLAESSKRRNHPANVGFHWRLFNMAQRARHQATAMRTTPAQADMFGVEALRAAA